MTTPAHEAGLSDGWIVELSGAGPATLYLTISMTKGRFGWASGPDQALALARQRDAEALARYAQARAPTGATAAPRRISWNREQADYEKENDRLRERVRDLESILGALRRIREAELDKAMDESQKGV